MVKKILLLAVFFVYSLCNAQTYSYDKNYDKYIQENGVVLNDKQKGELQKEIVKWAKVYLEKKYKYDEKVELTHPITKEKKTFRFDCSGFIAAVYWSANIMVLDKQAVYGPGGVKTIYATLDKFNKIYPDKIPSVGDVVMFDNTTGNDRPLTHIGIIIEVLRDGTVVFAHTLTSTGLTLGYMNLKQKDNNSKDVNSYLRGGVGLNGLSSKCFNSYATLF